MILNVSNRIEQGNEEAASMLNSSIPFRFEVGQHITHRDQPMLSIVLTRQHSSKGHEIYGVRAVDPNDPVRDRIMLGEVLVPADEPLAAA